MKKYFGRKNRKFDSSNDRQRIFPSLMPELEKNGKVVNIYDGQIFSADNKNDLINCLLSSLKEKSWSILSRKIQEHIDRHTVVNDNTEGEIVVNQDGEVTSQNKEGSRLLFMCKYPKITNLGISQQAINDELPVFLQSCHNNCKILPSDNGCKSDQSFFQHRNAWGDFLIHVVRQQDCKNRECTSVITIKYRESFDLHLLRQCREMSLTPKQTEVCVYLVTKLKYKEIAKRLDIAPATVIDHRMKIFDKFGVRTRIELIIYLTLSWSTLRPF